MHKVSAIVSHKSDNIKEIAGAKSIITNFHNTRIKSG